jgi:hypothetical protein
LTASVLVYPNPAEDVIMVNGAEGMLFEMIALDGRIVLNGNITLSANAIALDGVAAGSYMVRVINNEGSSVHQVIVK